MNTTKMVPVGVPAHLRGPFIIGDKVKFKGTRLYGEVAGFNCGILVRLKNGKMHQTTREHLEFVYGRRGS